jgi:hypothetical protein
MPWILPKPLADLLHPQIFRRFLAAVRDDIERHLGAIRQAVQAGLLDGRNMDENVPPPSGAMKP